MNSLQEKIDRDFVIAMKSGDVVKKNTLRSLKSKLTEAVKNNNNQSLTNDQIITVLNQSIKMREQAISAYESAKDQTRLELELEEKKILLEYLPEMMSEDEIEKQVRLLLTQLPSNTSTSKAEGLLMGMFTKKFKNSANSRVVMSVIKKVLAQNVEL